MVATPAAGIATIRIPPMAMPQWDDLIEEIKRTKLSPSLPELNAKVQM